MLVLNGPNMELLKQNFSFHSFRKTEAILLPIMWTVVFLAFLIFIRYFYNQYFLLLNVVLVQNMKNLLIQSCYGWKWHFLALKKTWNLKFGPKQVQCYEKIKQTGIIIRLFFYFTWGIPFKAKSSGYKAKWVEINGNYS